MNNLSSIISILTVLTKNCKMAFQRLSLSLSLASLYSAWRSGWPNWLHSYNIPGPAFESSCRRPRANFLRPWTTRTVPAFNSLLFIGWPIFRSFCLVAINSPTSLLHIGEHYHTSRHHKVTFTLTLPPIRTVHFGKRLHFQVLDLYGYVVIIVSDFIDESLFSLLYALM